MWGKNSVGDSNASPNMTSLISIAPSYLWYSLFACSSIRNVASIVINRDREE